MNKKANYQNLLYNFILSLIVIVAYWWLKTPVLNQFSLQAFAFILLIYFGFKHWQRKHHALHFAPRQMSLEIGALLFGILLLIGATGNQASIFYPLTFLNLFFLAFATPPATAILIAILLMWFFYAIDPALNWNHLLSLFELPFLTLIFLFARKQYWQTQQINQKVRQQDLLLQNENREILSFFRQSLKPQLQNLTAHLNTLGDQAPEKLVENIQQQIIDLENRLQQYANLEQKIDNAETKQ